MDHTRATRPAARRSPLQTAMEQRLADQPTQRWLWAAGCALPVLGVPLLLWHGRERRTALPFLYGLTCQAIAAFALASLAGALWLPPAALVLGAALCFALGHRQGQEKAARDASIWMRLDG
ncbi:MAG: hypothetical protein ACKOZT_07210 [Cyanobium sp.]